MQLTLRTDRASYRPGEPVSLQLELFNNRAEPVRLRFNTSQQCDFEVLWEDQRLWHWAADRLFAQAETVLTLAPGQRHLYEATWDGRNNDGTVARPGEYIARGFVTVSGRAGPMADQSFTIA